MGIRKHASLVWSLITQPVLSTTERKAIIRVTMIEATLVEISVGALKRIGATCYTCKESEVKQEAKMIRRYLLCTDSSSLSKSTEALHCKRCQVLPMQGKWRNGHKYERCHPCREYERYHPHIIPAISYHIISWIWNMRDTTPAAIWYHDLPAAEASTSQWPVMVRRKMLHKVQMRWSQNPHNNGIWLACSQIWRWY